jgi:hypothetical protein
MSRPALGHTHPLSMGSQSSFPLGYIDRGMMLSNSLHLVPHIIMIFAIYVHQLHILNSKYTQNFTIIANTKTDIKEGGKDHLNYQPLQPTSIPDKILLIPYQWQRVNDKCGAVTLESKDRIIINNEPNQ